MNHAQIRRAALTPPLPTQRGLIVGGRLDYAHAQARSATDVDRLAPLLRAAYERASGRRAWHGPRCRSSE